jgi:integrase
LVAVAYDTMCRRDELVNLRIEDIAESADRSGSVLIQRSKTDTSGEGATAYLSPLTMRLVAAWVEASQLKSGPIFARVVGRDGIGDASWKVERHAHADEIWRKGVGFARCNGASSKSTRTGFVNANSFTQEAGAYIHVSERCESVPGRCGQNFPVLHAPSNALAFQLPAQCERRARVPA